MVEFVMIDGRRCAMLVQSIVAVIQAKDGIVWQVLQVTGNYVEVTSRTARRLIRIVSKARTFPGDEWRAGVYDE